MKKKTTISPKVRELIEHGTTADKVLAVIIEWADAYARDKEPTITDEERKAILDTLTRSDWNVYFSYYVYYNTFVTFSTRLGLAKAIYEKDASQLIGNYKAIQAVERTLTNMLKASHKQKSEILNEISDLVEWQGKYEIVDGKSPRFFCKAIDGVKWWDDLKKGIGQVRADLKLLGEMIKGIDVFCRRAKRTTTCKKHGIDPKRAIPPLVKAVIAEVKADYVKDEAPALSKAILERRLKRGEVVSAEERARAIFPTYKEVEAEADDVEVEYWVAMLEQQLREEQRNIKEY